jgi:RNA polymerase sigma factor (sigma-70 family)
MADTLLMFGWASVFHRGTIALAPSSSGDDASDGARDGAHRFSRPSLSDDVAPKRHDAAAHRIMHVNGIPIATLLDELRSGSKDAFSALYLAFHPRLWRLGVILTRSTETAEEVVQDVLFSLWRHRETLARNTDVHAYLYSAVRNRARSIGRHAQVVGVMEQEVVPAHFVPALGQHGAIPDRVTESNEFLDAYQRAMTTLTERERIALQLRAEEELSFEEIGTLLGISKMGAHKIVVRAVAKLGELLAAYRP